MLQRSEEAAQTTVKVYLRNQQKIAKIMNFPPCMPARELYQHSSLNYNLPIESIHLYYAGNPINPEDEVPLQNNTIIHIVNLPKLTIETLTLNIKRVPGDHPSIELHIPKSTKIKEFMDGLLSRAIGLDSKKAFLVHMGRQLELEKTFGEEEVESQSELICMTFEEEKEEDDNTENVYRAGSDSNVIINLRQTSHSHKSKEIYPFPDFLLDEPHEIDSKNKLNLIFDARIRKSSSIQGIDFEPADIIQEQPDLELVGRTSYQSEHYSEHNSNRKYWNEPVEVGQEGDSHLKSRHKEEELQEHRHDHIEAGDLIYSGESSGLNSRGLMKNLINGFRQKLKEQKEEEKVKDQQD